MHDKKKKKEVEMNYNHNHRVSIFNFLSFAFKNVAILVFIQIHILSYLYYMFWWQFRIYDTFSIHSNGSLILRMCLVWLLLHFSPNWKEYQIIKLIRQSLTEGQSLPWLVQQYFAKTLKLDINNFKKNSEIWIDFKFIIMCR